MSDLNATRNTWIAFGSLSLGLAAGMYNLTIAPIDNRVEYLSQQLDAQQVAIASMQTQQATTATHIDYIRQSLDRIELTLGESKSAK